MKKNDIQEVYCIGSIPVDTGQISLYDLEVKKIKKSLNERELVRNIIDGKKINRFKDKGLNITCFADGAYPCYVVVDQNKLVKKILIELTNTCGWGSSLFDEECRIQKLESELTSKSKLPYDQQIDMVAGVRSSVDFSTSHRVTYSPWRNLDFAKDDKKFLKKKGNTKTKLFELNVSSEFLVIDDYPGINSSDIKKIKNNEKKSDYDRFKIKEKFIFPVKKKNYPVYLYHSNKSERETIEEIKNVENKDQSPAMFPILSIEGIENCRLQKSFDSSLIFESDKNKFRGAGNNFWGQVDTMKEDEITDFHLKICQLDFGDFSDIDVLKSVTQYSVVPKKLTLRHFRHINNWKILHKFFDLEEIHFDNCKINLEGKKKNDWFDIMSKFNYNRKNNKELNDKYGDLKVFVNGQEVFE